MADLSFRERLRITALAADRSRRGALSRVLNTRALRWRYGKAHADQLLIVPQDLRTADPSFLEEIGHDQFGLAGTIARLEGRSPFDIRPPNDGWARELHGFGWLRHLSAAGDDTARDVGRSLAYEWTIRHRSLSGLPAEPDVIGRRLISWIANAHLLLEDADAKAYAALLDALARDRVLLAATWRRAGEGYPRLLALVALALADLAIAGQARHLPDAERELSAELAKQILTDGGHLSRNPGVLVELMLDLLPLSQCFVARERPLPQALTDTLQRIQPMLRQMRLGDGMLARFNGVGIGSPAGLATVLAYDDGSAGILVDAPASKYLRLERGRTVLVADVGMPPPLEVAGEASAGCLSFELSVGAKLVFVNGGRPGAADADWIAASRATASHNTLVIADKSSSKLVRNAVLEKIAGAAPIQSPDHVQSKLTESPSGVEFEAAHDGYVSRYGWLHRRAVALDASGQRLVGTDQLEAPRGVAGSSGLPFAIHFHVHPDASCRIGRGHNTAEVQLPDGIWHFSVQGAGLTIEESTYFADSSGPRRALQIVLRGVIAPGTEVRWVFEAAAD